jgi:hypothetical protein
MHKRSRRLVIALVALTLASASACSALDSLQSTVSVTVPSFVTVTITEQAPTDARASGNDLAANQTPQAMKKGLRDGFDLLKLGQTGTIPSGVAADDAAVVFTVDDIVVDAPCDDPSIQPESGHFLALHMRVALSMNFAESGMVAFIPDPVNFRVMRPDGSMQNAIATSPAALCLASMKRMPGLLDVPGSTAAGWVILDSDSEHGSVLLTQIQSDTGWEWRF